MVSYFPGGFPMAFLGFSQLPMVFPMVFRSPFEAVMKLAPGCSAAGRQLGQLPRLAAQEVRDARARVLTT